MTRIIIVDDERVIRETIFSIVDWKSMGVEVAGVCKDGIEAYDMIMDEYPDIVMTDIKMPGLSGLDLIRNVCLADMDIVFIILSGYNDFEFAQAAMQYGVKHYLLKPCNENKIAEVMSASIEECHRRRMLKFDVLIRDIFDANQCIIETNKNKFMALFSSLSDENLAKTILIRLLMQYVCGQSNPTHAVQVTDYIISLNNCHTMGEIMVCADQLFTDILHDPYEQTNTSDFINKLQDYVCEHLETTNLSLKWISENYLYMNVDYVSKQFVKQTGMKFSDFLAKERIKMAKQLILENKCNKIYIVAEAVGYGDNPHYFSQIFKKYMHMTPTDYIKMIHGD